MTTKTTILNRLADEARHVAKTTTIDLDAFLALCDEERAARWRQLDRGAKFQLVALKLERKTGDWSDRQVGELIGHYDAKWNAASTESDIPIPPAADICAVAAERAATAHRDGDMARARQLDRMCAHVIRAPRITWNRGDLLVQSVNNVYTVRGPHGVCTCPCGVAGQFNCWHVALRDILIEMQEEAAATRDAEAMRADAAELGRRIAMARRTARRA